LERLVALGYTRVPLVENPGEFARRGGIVDVYPAASAVDEDGADGGAFRLDFFGDEIDSLRRLDPVTQRSQEEAPGCLLAPPHEVLPPLEPTAAEAVAALDLNALRDDVATAIAREREQLLAGETFAQLEDYRAYLGHASLLDYLPSDGLLLLDEPSHLAE